MRTQLAILRTYVPIASFQNGISANNIKTRQYYEYLVLYIAAFSFNYAKKIPFRFGCIYIGFLLREMGRRERERERPNEGERIREEAREPLSQSTKRI